MPSFDEEEADEPHMLAVGTGDDDLLPDDDNILDDDEEMMLMHAKESMDINTTPPPPSGEEEPAFVNKPNAPAAPTGGVDDSFESFIYESDGSEDFQTRGRNHVIPVINSSPSKKKRPDNITENLTDPTAASQSPISSNGSPAKGDSPNSSSPERGSLFGRKSYGGMYISPPSSSDYEASPTEARGAPQSAFSDPRRHQAAAAAAASMPQFRYTAPGVIQATPVVSKAHAQSGPPTIPDGKTPIILDAPPISPGYRKPSSKSRAIAEQSASSRKGWCGGCSSGSSNQNNAFICGMNKLTFCILAFYILFMTGCFCYFVSQYVQIPSLREQVETLSAEVDRLEAQVDELELLIVDLNETVTKLQVENDKLETQNAVLAEANDTFGNQTGVLQEQIDTLQGTVSNLTLANEALKEEAFNLELLNGELTNLTLALEANNTELAARAENLTTINEELIESNEALTNQTDKLQESLEELVGEFDAAYAAAAELEDEVGSLQEENSRLENLTQSLGTILSFLEETNQDADVTVDQLAGQLEDQITNNRRLVLENFKNTLIQRTQTWNCDYINAFPGTSFAEDYSVSIPSGSYDAVLDYVEGRVLKDLCLDRSDFELYLSINFMPNGDGLTSEELISGVSMYTSDALDHYFPDSGETGVSTEEWAEASYDCSNLPPERQYRSII